MAAPWLAPRPALARAKEGSIRLAAAQLPAIRAQRRQWGRWMGEIQWAFCSLQRSAWTREFYDEKIAAGVSHHPALRKRGNRSLEVLWHCLHKGVCYDDAIHAANRKSSRPPATAA